MKILILLAFSFSSQAAFAEDCSSVIALSKISSTTIASKDTIDQAASNFCNEYSSSKSSGKSMNISASYYAISGSFGSSSSDIEQVASKYCAADGSYHSAANAYQQYVDSIAPGAFDAYNQCLYLASSDIKFSVEQASILPRQLAMTVNYTNDRGLAQNAHMAFLASDGIDCSWYAGHGSDVTLASAQMVTLNCRRNTTNKKGFITIFRRDGNVKITLPWPAYTDEGVPVDTVLSMTQQIDGLKKQLVSVSGAEATAQASLADVISKASEERTSLSYTITPNSVNCPAGWADQGIIGVIMHNPDYAHGNLGQGGGFNDDWTWTHPHLCKRV